MTFSLSLHPGVCPLFALGSPRPALKAKYDHLGPEALLQTE